MVRPSVWRVWLGCTWVVLAGCNSYASELLNGGRPIACGDGEVGPGEVCDLGIAAGRPGACPERCPESTDACAPILLVGDACQAQCAVASISGARNGDGCCPPEQDATTDSDCGSCGDGIVGPTETCDPPESCLLREDCEMELGCAHSVYSGSAESCTAFCTLEATVACGKADGCCPADCDPKRDRDCSDSCGDGIVEHSAGEVCEPGEGPQACPTSCDDRDPCTDDMMLGQLSHCDVKCMHVPRAMATAGVECGPGPGMAAAALVHRYSFDGTGAEVRDSIGQAHGKLVNAVLRGDGVLALAMSRQAYVSLPAGLLSAHASGTLEFWVTWSGNLRGRAERIFDFGSATGMGADFKLDSTLFLSPNDDDAGATHLRFHSDKGEDSQLTPMTKFPTGGPVHGAVVLDAERQSMSLYINGELAGSAPWKHSLKELRDTNAWLGRSQNPSDPNLFASFDEFRIHDGALTAEQVARSFKRGPAQLP